MRATLYRLWRRMRSCRRGEHRETAEMTGGYLLQLRCIDCGLTRSLGFVVRASNNLRPQTWERDDA